MNSRIKSFFNTSIIYFFGKVLSLAVSVFLLPIYTKNISPSDYGNYETIRSVLNLLIPFLCLEMWFGVLRLFFLPEFNKKEKTLFSTSFIFCLIIAALISCGYIIFSSFIFQKHLVLIIVLVFIEIINFLFMYFSRCFKKNVAFSVSGVIASLTNAGAGIICVFVFHLKEESMFVAMISGYFLQAVILFFSIKGWKHLSFKSFDFKTLGKLFKYCWPLSFITVVNYLSNDFNKLVLDGMISSDRVGYYSVAMKFVSLIVLLASVIEMSWMEMTFKIDDASERKNTIINGTNQAMKIFCCLSLLGLFVIQIAFPVLIDKEYNTAKEIIPILYGSSFFIMSKGMLSNPSKSENKNYIDLIAKGGAAIFNIILLFVLIKYINIYAACIAYLVGSVVQFYILALCNRLILSMSFNIVPSFAFSGLYLVFIGLYYLDSLVLTIIGIIAILLFSVIYLRKELLIILKRVGFDCESFKKKMFADNYIARLFFICLAVFAFLFIINFASIILFNYVLNNPILKVMTIVVTICEIIIMFFIIINKKNSKIFNKYTKVFFILFVPLFCLPFCGFVSFALYKYGIVAYTGNGFYSIVNIGLLLLSYVIFIQTRKNYIFNEDET